PATCDNFGPHIEIAIDDATAYVDGTPVADLGVALSVRYMLGKWVGELPLGVLAAEDAPFAAVRARIGVAQRVGFRQIFAITRPSRPPVVSSSLGALPRSPRICLVWLSDTQLASASAPSETWGAFVARAAAPSR
ncbi:MAG: hypothetical protein HOO96_07275, partial [Polyangiaceae bacterium]|nr:hypothetical protein [Polyangiaceae bacterium]